MIKNRTVQMIYQIIFCVLGFWGILASLGLFNQQFESEFYVYFTNLSNYLCIVIGLAELIQTVKKKKDSYVDKWPALKFVGLLAILFTFIVFNEEYCFFPLKNFPMGKVDQHNRMKSVV